MKQHSGFTLIELMVVVAILGILTSIALPAYRNYLTTSADNACLNEVKGYVSISLAMLFEGLDPDTPNASACESIDTATNYDTPVTATPKSPGLGSIECDMLNGGACVLTPG